MSSLHHHGALTGAHRARAQWDWHGPPSAKQTAEREEINSEGREPGEEAEWLGSWPNGKGLNGLHQLLTAPQISSLSFPAHCVGTRGTQNPFAWTSPRIHKRLFLKQHVKQSEMFMILRDVTNWMQKVRSPWHPLIKSWSSSSACRLLIVIMVRVFPLLQGLCLNVDGF